MVGWIILVVSFVMSLGMTTLVIKNGMDDSIKNRDGRLKGDSLMAHIIAWWIFYAAYLSLLIFHTAITLSITGIVLAISLAVFGLLAAFDPNSSSAKLWNSIKEWLNSLTKPKLPTNPQ